MTDDFEKRLAKLQRTAHTGHWSLDEALGYIVLLQAECDSLRNDRERLDYLEKFYGDCDVSAPTTRAELDDEMAAQAMFDREIAVKNCPSNR